MTRQVVQLRSDYGCEETAEAKERFFKNRRKIERQALGLAQSAT